MNLKKLWSVALLCTVLFQGCKKDDDSTAKYLYFNGKVSISIPAYVRAGDTFTFEKSAISTLGTSAGSEDETIRYFVTDPYTGVNDTLDTDWERYTFTVADTLGTFSLSLKGFLGGYVNSGSTVVFTTVDPSPENGSLTGLGILPSDPSFVDGRDGRRYFYTSIGNLQWTRTNLAYCGAGAPFENAEVMTDIYGRFYSYEEALTACPEGWRLPTDEEFSEMTGIFGDSAGALMVYTELNGVRMWEHWSSVNVTNESLLGIIPVGYACPVQDGLSFIGANDYAAVWTSSIESGMGVYRYIHSRNDNVFRGTQSTTGFALPVRCVRENNR